MKTRIRHMCVSSSLDVSLQRGQEGNCAQECAVAGNVATYKWTPFLWECVLI